MTRVRGNSKERRKLFIRPLHQYLYENIYCTDKSIIDCAMVEGRGAEWRREQTAEQMSG